MGETFFEFTTEDAGINCVEEKIIFINRDQISYIIQKTGAVNCLVYLKDEKKPIEILESIDDIRSLFESH